jgi:phosphoribosylformylglycinamidine synthase
VRVLVLRAAGTNCDRETAHAFERVGATAEARHVNELLKDPTLLRDYKILVIPGGFSYGDDVAAGRVLATELKQKILPETWRFVGNGGLVLGICNGFQVLVKMGLLPGWDEQVVTLTHNDSHRYQDEWVDLDVVTNRCEFVGEGQEFAFPIAHAEGKFVADDATLARLEESGQVVFRYRRKPEESQRIAERHRRHLRHDRTRVGIDAPPRTPPRAVAPPLLDPRGPGRGAGRPALLPPRRGGRVVADRAPPVMVHMQRT